MRKSETKKQQDLRFVFVDRLETYQVTDCLGRAHGRARWLRVHDVEGGRTRAVWENGIRSVERDPPRSTLRFVQAQQSSLLQEDDTWKEHPRTSGTRVVTATAVVGIWQTARLGAHRAQCDQRVEQVNQTRHPGPSIFS